MLGLALANEGRIVAFVVIVTIFFVAAISSGGNGRRGFRPRRRYSRPSYGPFQYEQARDVDLRDVGQQMNAVMAASFEKQRLLNFSEYRAFKIIESDLASARQGYRIFAQTSLGEVLKSRDKDAFHSINSKRVDMLIIDQGGWPVLAVEYQGEGHYKGTAAARDAVKKEALRKAGVGYLEITATDSDAQIRSHVREQLGWETETRTNRTNSPDADSLAPPAFGRRQRLVDGDLSPTPR